MNSSLPSPENLTVNVGDCSAEITWDEANGASGYRLRLFLAKKPDTCIKSYRCRTCRKALNDLTNGEDYLVSVAAVTYLGTVEFPGEESQRLRFTPICEHLKAQSIVCISTGETAKISWEYKNKIPRAEFFSEDESIATVDASGAVTGVSKGVTHVTVKAMGEEYRTRVAVDRQMKLQRGKAVLMLTGDIMCSARHQQLAERYSYDFNKSFDSIKKTLSEADLSIGVLGTSCCDSTAYESEMYKLPNGTVNRNSPSTFLSAIANAGFGGLVTATGNCCTAGKKGLLTTTSLISDLGLRNIGTLGANPVLISTKGIRVAYIAAAHIDAPTAMPMLNDDKRSLVGQFSRDSFERAVKAARKKGADYVIAFRCRAAEDEAVLQSMSEEAQFIANCGVDLIVGTYPTGVRKFRYLTTKDGRRVPCAYSLGSLLNCGPNGCRSGAVLRAELTKDENGKVKAEFSYIPCRSEERAYGAETRPAYPNCTETGRRALAEIAEAMGKDISIFGKRPRVLINGSLILEKIFSSDKSFRIDKTGLLISPLAVCGTPDYEYSEKDGNYAKVDICKTLPDYIDEVKPDFVAVDFYTSAGLSSYKLRDNIFTGTKTFTRSAFYLLHKEELERLRPPIDEEIWKPRLRAYAEMLLKNVPSERIVLFRHRFPGKALRDGNIRSTTVPSWLNNSISAMEDYFAKLASPSVVDISDGYFTAGKQYSDFEKEYFADAYRAFKNIAQNGHRFEYLPDTELRFNRLLNRYDSISERGHFDWLLKFDSAADQIIAYTSRQFAAANSERLIRLKKAGRSDLSCVADFFAGDLCAEPLIDAANIIDAVLSGDLTKPYEFYLPAFSGKFNILKKMATLLSEEIGQPVGEQDAELVFMLRGRPQLEKYINSVASTTVDIWGTSISRDSLRLADGVHIGNEIYRQPPVLAYDTPVQTQFSEDLRQFGGNARRRMYLTEALMRTGLEVVEESRSKWLLIDLYELINVMADYDGDLFEIDDFTVKTGFYKNIKDECTECMLEDYFGEEACISRLDRFAADMLGKYEDNIILIRSEPKKTKNMTPEAIAAFDRKKTFLKRCEESFIASTRCYIINISERFNEVEQVTSKVPRTVHYEKEFYRLCGRYITDIVRGTDKKVFTAVDESYILLRTIKNKKPKGKK